MRTGRATSLEHDSVATSIGSPLAIPGYALDKSGKPVRSTKRMPVSKRIVQRKSKRVTPKRGKRLPE